MHLYRDCGREEKRDRSAELFTHVQRLSEADCSEMRALEGVGHSILIGRRSEVY